MVRNFNTALSLARGSYVVMITDDDPVYSHHLRSLREATQLHPGYGCYFGAGEVHHESAFVATCSNSHLGTSGRPLDNRMHCYDGPHFLEAFFQNRIPFYMLWSCGIVRRDIAQRIGMPDYGSPFLTDFAYIALTSAQAGAVILHTALGRQNVHTANFGRREVHELPEAINGFLSLFPQPQYSPKTRSDAIRFLTRWCAAHLWFLQRYYSSEPAMLEKVRECVRLLTTEAPLTALRHELFIFGIKQSVVSRLRCITHPGRRYAAPN